MTDQESAPKISLGEVLHLLVDSEERGYIGDKSAAHQAISDAYGTENPRTRGQQQVIKAVEATVGSEQAPEDQQTPGVS